MRQGGSWVVMTTFVVYSMTMKQVSIVDFKKRLSSYVALAEGGEDVQVLKRHIPVAQLVGIPGRRANLTKIGFAKGTVQINGDLTEPFMPTSDWGMLSEEGF